MTSTSPEAQPRTVFHLVVIFCMATVQAAGVTIDISVASGGSVEGLANYREGANLTLRCEVTGLVTSTSDYTVSWQHGVEVISWGDALMEPYANEWRFAVEFIPLPGRGDTTENVAYDLTISPVQRGDAGDYSCLVKTLDPVDSMSFNTVNFKTITLSVEYFPDESSPTCIPNGLTDVHEGKTLLLRCSSEKGNPDVQLTLSNIGDYPWSTIRDRDIVSQELLIDEVDVFNDGLVFICSISSPVFPSDTRSCQLGPLNVIPRVTNPSTKASPGPNNPIGPGSSEPTTTTAPSEPACLLWFIAFLVATGIAAVSILIIVVMLTRRRMEKDRNKENQRQVEKLPLDDVSKKDTVATSEEGAYTNMAVGAV